MSARVAPTSEYRAQARGKSTLDAVDMWRELLQQAPVSERCVGVGGLVFAFFVCLFSLSASHTCFQNATVSDLPWMDRLCSFYLATGARAR